MICKYPPIEGGVSRQSFWTSVALAQRGFGVHIVTNASEVEDEYRIQEHLSGVTSRTAVLSEYANGVTEHASRSSRYQRYIPWTNPFVTKLAGIAAAVTKDHQCELILGHYLEPYGMAAYLASQWTGVPYGLRHAGSDVGRLFQSSQIRTSLTNVINSADFILASPSTYRGFLGLGVDLEKMYLWERDSLPTRYFRVDASPFDIGKLLTTVRDELPDSYLGGVFHRLAPETFDPTIPTVGIYGKVGETKGSFDLVRALGELKAQGVRFNFLALTQGRTRTVERFLEEIERYSLSQCTWLIPFIPHWNVPNFIRACTVICFLEREFPVAIHKPTVPREVFACGVCLVLSHEIADKQTYQKPLIDRQNVLLANPKDTADLVRALRYALTEPEVSQEIGLRGYLDFSQDREDFGDYADRLRAVFTTISQDTAYRREIMSLAEMQAYLARLYTSETFRKFHHLDLEANTEGYKLSADEIEAIRGIDRKSLDFFASSLRNKRRKRFEAAYSLTFRLNEQEMARYFDRYYEIHPGSPYQPVFSQIIEFGQFLEESLSTDNDLPPFASNVTRFERLHYCARFVPTEKDSFLRLNDNSGGANTQFDLDAKPHVGEGNYLGDFEYDIVPIVEELKRGTIPHHPAPGQYTYVFHQVVGSLSPEVYSLNRATRELVRLCDGKNSIKEIVRYLELSLDKSNLETGVIQILQKLMLMGVIKV